MTPFLLLWHITGILQVSPNTEILSSEVIWESSGRNVLRQARTSPGLAFSSPDIEMVANKILDRQSSKPFAVIQLFVDRSAEQRHNTEIRLSTGGYSQGRFLYEIKRKQRVPAAEIIKVRGNAVLRWRDTKGSVGYRVLRGIDPLVLKVAKRQMRIANFSFQTLTGIKAGTDDPHVRVFIISPDNLTIELGLDVAQHLERLLPIRRAFTELVIRNDEWFLADTLFPPSFALAAKAPHLALRPYEGLFPSIAA